MLLQFLFVALPVLCIAGVQGSDLLTLKEVEQKWLDVKSQHVTSLQQKVIRAGNNNEEANGSKEIKTIVDYSKFGTGWVEDVVFAPGQECKDDAMYIVDIFVGNCESALEDDDYFPFDRGNNISAFKNVINLEDCSLAKQLFSTPDCSGEITWWDQVKSLDTTCGATDSPLVAEHKLRCRADPSTGHPANIGDEYFRQVDYTSSLTCVSDKDITDFYWYFNSEHCYTLEFVDGQVISFRWDVQTNDENGYKRDVYVGPDCSESYFIGQVSAPLHTCHEMLNTLPRPSREPLTNETSQYTEYFEVPRKCLWETGCDSANPCEPGSYCEQHMYWSQCLEDLELLDILIERKQSWIQRRLTPASGHSSDTCYSTYNGGGSTHRWGCASDEECCNAAASCHNKLCALECRGEAMLGSSEANAPASQETTTTTAFTAGVAAGAVGLVGLACAVYYLAVLHMRTKEKNCAAIVIHDREVEAEIIIGDSISA